MKVFLRNKKTRLFCADPDGWTGAVEQALDYSSISQATRFALDEELPFIELVVKYDILPDEVPVPLLPQWRDFGKLASAAP
jgi:hypothetical protein